MNVISQFICFQWVAAAFGSHSARPEPVAAAPARRCEGQPSQVPQTPHLGPQALEEERARPAWPRLPNFKRGPLHELLLQQHALAGLLRRHRGEMPGRPISLLHLVHRLSYGLIVPFENWINIGGPFLTLSSGQVTFCGASMAFERTGEAKLEAVGCDKDNWFRVVH